MIVIYINTYSLSANFPDFLNENFDKNKYMILDIETTGLSPKFTNVILVGIIYHQNDCWYLTQFFCDHRSEEKELLLKLKDYIDDHLIITYNGHAFDIPYLNARYKAHAINYQISMAKHFDLYRVVRASKKALDLPNYKLKTIEEYLGIYRTDQISGKESVDLYNQYEERPSDQLRDIILLHNSDDIEFMIPTMKILDHVPDDIISRYFPFPSATRLGEISCISFEVQKDYVAATFELLNEHADIADYRNGYSYEIKDNLLKIQLPVFYIGDRKFIDVDLLDFINVSFNDLSYDQQIKYEVTTKKEALKCFVQVIKEHTL